MLEPPGLPEEKILACLRGTYGIPSHHIEFLPLGVDTNAAVYRAVAEDGARYFVKLRRGRFDELNVVLPKFLHAQGLAQIIPPCFTQAGQLWASLEEFTVILYPYLEGQDGYQVSLSEQQWRDFGAALRQIHSIALPTNWLGRLPVETYSSQWREKLAAFLERAENETVAEEVAAQAVAFLRNRRTELLQVIERTEQLTQTLQVRPMAPVLCHADLHPGNLLISSDGALYIVDWDAPCLAPKERDLMFIGGGYGFAGYTAEDETKRFYQGYGSTPVDLDALAYYRYARIIEDMALFCEQLLTTTDGGSDRGQALQFMASNFRPGHTLEAARRADRLARKGSG